MSRNAYAQKALANRAGRDKMLYEKGYNDGVTIALNIVAIALNDAFGFGGERLTKLESHVQELFDEVISVGDPEVNQYHIEQRVKQIRGEEYEVWSS